MTCPNSLRTVVVWVTCVAAMTGAGAARALQAGDRIATARQLYASASYEDALRLLDTVQTDPAVVADERATVEKYRAFCLVALDRLLEARTAIEAFQRYDIGYSLTDTEAAPRVRAMFEDVRKRVWPDVVNAKFADAKSRFDRKEYEPAAEGFRATIAMIERQPHDTLTPHIQDLRTLAAGFLDLTQGLAATRVAAVPASTVPPATVTPRATGSAPPGPSSSEAAAVESEATPAVLPPIYDMSTAGVTPPEVVQKPFARHAALRLAALGAAKAGTVVELIIAQDGSVEGATLRTRNNQVYDQLLLTAVKSWRYTPALLAGDPVRFRLLVRVE